MNTKQLKKLLILNIPYIILGLAATNLGEAWRLAARANASKKIQSLVLDGVLQTAFSNPLPSLNSTDLLTGIICGAALRIAVYLKGKNAKKFRHNEEYGSARWGRHEDRATVKSYRKMREDALNGDPIAKERYEKTLAMRREAYYSKKSEQTA